MAEFQGVERARVAPAPALAPGHQFQQAQADTVAGVLQPKGWRGAGVGGLGERCAARPSPTPPRHHSDLRSSSPMLLTRAWLYWTSSEKRKANAAREA